MVSVAAMPDPGAWLRKVPPALTVASVGVEAGVPPGDAGVVPPGVAVADASV
jgi:hypothetical protein